MLLQKELGMHVLMSTHSPYFLNAIEVYSKKHAVDGLCSYYLAETCADGRSRFAEITGSTEVAYEKLAAPFDTLEREEYGLSSDLCASCLIRTLPWCQMAAMVAPVAGPVS